MLELGFLWFLSKVRFVETMFSQSLNKRLRVDGFMFLLELMRFLGEQNRPCSDFYSKLFVLALSEQGQKRRTSSLCLTRLAKKTMYNSV